jgi:hypothetical protein
VSEGQSVVPTILTGVASVALLTLGFNMIVPLSSTWIPFAIWPASSV